MPSLKPGGGGKNQGEAVRSAERRGEGGREAASPLRNFSPGLLFSSEDGQMSASAHFNDSITANGLKQEKEANGTPRPLTEKALME